MEGEQIAGSLINGAFGLFGIGAQARHNEELARLNNYYAVQREKDARKENFEYGEKSAQNADARTRGLYNDLYSIQAQMQQAKAAGLSPSIFGSALSGMSGASGQMGTGASGISPTIFGQQPVDIMGAMANASQIANTNANTELTKAKTEGQNIQNADDPVIAKYIVEKQQSIENANAEEAQLINNAFAGLQSQLTQIGVFSEGTTFSISHGEGSSESEASSWSFNIHDSNGQTESHQLGGSFSSGLSVGLKGVGANGSISGNKGESHGENKSHGEGEGQSEAYAWAKHVLDSKSEGRTQSGNRREAENVLAIFYNQCAEAITRFNDTRTNAREKYEFQVWRYEKNRDKKK